MASKQQMLDLIAEWKELDRWIKAHREAPGQTTVEQDQERVAELARKRDRRHKLAERIYGIIENNPRFSDEALDAGFSPPGVEGKIERTPTPTPEASPTPQKTKPDPTATGTQGPQSGGSGGSGGAGGGQGSGGGKPDPTATGSQGPQSGGGSDTTTGDGTGNGTGGGGGDGGAQAQQKLRRATRDNRLLGDEGKEFNLVHNPSGMYVAMYTFTIHGEKTRVGIKLGKDGDKLSRYGLKANQAKELNREQAKRIKNIGWADELAPYIRRGDTSVFKAVVRNLEARFPKSVSGAILRDDEVVSKIIARSLFGWDDATFEAQMRDTRWWNSTEPYQREWSTSQSAKQKSNAINRTLETVVNRLEDNFGLDWSKHVDGGMKKARQWAENIASGKWGEPGDGMTFWEDRIFDRASKIENTPAWIQQQQEQEELNKFANRPDEMFEQLRSDALAYLGEDKNQTPRIDRNTLQKWATDIVTGDKDEGDWQEFLRKQMGNLFPHFDPNVAFTDQASPYKSTLERVIGTTVDWADPYLRDLSGRDDNGKPTGSPMSLYEYEQYVRDNDPRFWDNPATDERGRSLVAEIMARTGLG